MINFCATQGPPLFRCLSCKTVYLRGWYMFCPRCGSGAFHAEVVVDFHKYVKLTEGVWVLKEDD